MISESRGLYELVEDSLDRDLANEAEKNPVIKGFIKKDISGNFSIGEIDGKAEDWTIRCIFSASGLKTHLDSTSEYNHGKLDYDSWNKSFIMLKKYRFDYLILADEKSLSFRVVCYIDEFEIDTNYKSKQEGVGKNINFALPLAKKVEKIANNYLRKIIDQKVNDDQPLIFNARNFISHNFTKDKFTLTIPDSSTVYEMLRQAKNATDNNILVKTEISIFNPWTYIHDIEVDKLTVEKIQKFDYTNVFCSLPTSIEKGKGHEFVVSEYEVKRSIDPSENPLFAPTTLKIGIKDTEENIRQFLMRKVKRHRQTKDFETLPENMKNIVRRYGDVCANITHGLFTKYEEFKKFQNFGGEENEIFNK